MLVLVAIIKVQW